MEELSKTITKQWIACRKCDKKMEKISIKSGGSDLFGFGLGSDSHAYYCNDKECERFGDLTVAGIKREE